MSTVRTIWWRNVEQRRLAYYRQAEQSIRGVFRKEKAAVLSALKSGSSAPEDAIEREIWVPYVMAIWRTVLADFGTWVALDTGGSVNADNLPTGIKADDDIQWMFDPWSPAVRRYVTAYVAEKVTYITEATKRAIKAVVADGLSNNLSTSQIAVSIEKLYADFDIKRAYRIARTEIVGASSFGILEAAQQSGFDLLKEWVSMKDQRVRDSHNAVDGEIRELDQPFSNGLQYPGDPAGPAHEVVNCRCGLRLVRRKAA